MLFNASWDDPNLVISHLWHRLLQVQHLSFSAQSKAKPSSGWNGTGKAYVQVEAVTCDSMIFKEQGSWTSPEGQHFDFKNALRWSWQKSKAVIQLEHLHQGLKHPVVLFELKPVSHTRFEIVQPFLCKPDTYIVHLYCDPQFIQFQWQVVGPRKNEEISSIYR